MKNHKTDAKTRPPQRLALPVGFWPSAEAKRRRCAAVLIGDAAVVGEPSEGSVQQSSAIFPRGEKEGKEKAELVRPDFFKT